MFSIARRRTAGVASVFWPFISWCVCSSWDTAGVSTTSSSESGNKVKYYCLVESIKTSLLFSPLVVSDPLQPHALQHATMSFTISLSLLKLMSIKSVMPSSHLILCHPLLLPPSTLPSIRVFSNESTLHIRWPKYWSFSFNISPSNEHPVLISFRMDWLDLLAVQGTLKSLLQHQS